MRKFIQAALLISVVGSLLLITQTAYVSAAGNPQDELPDLFTPGNVISPNSKYMKFEVLEVKGSWVRTKVLRNNGDRTDHEAWIQPSGIWNLVD